MRRVYLETVLVELGVVGSTILTFRLAANHWGADGFGEYVLSRRGIGLLQLPLALGLGVSLPRFIAAGEDRSGDPSRYLAGALLLVALIACPVLLLVAAVPSWGAVILYGGPEWTPLLRPLCLAVLGLLVHSVAVAEARGRLAMRRANGLQLLGLGLVPAVAVSLAPSVETALAGMGIGWVVVGGAAVRAGLARRGWLGAYDEARTLLRFGLPRVPGDAALMALLALPAVIAAHRFGMVIAGHVAFAVTVGSSLGTLVAPLGTVFLPVASRRASRGEWAGVRRGAVRVLGWGLAAVVPVALVVVGAAPLVVRLALGDGFEAAVSPVRIVGAAGVAYAVYVALRNVLEASVTAALNTRNLIVALVVFLAGALAAPGAAGLARALAAGFVVLGLATGWDAFRILRRSTTVLAAR